MAIERWERAGFLAGPAFVATMLVSGLLPGEPPNPDASGADIARFFVDKQTEIQIASVISAASIIFALWWIASLWRTMTKAEYGKPRLALVGTLGFLFGGVMFGIAQILWASAAMSGELAPDLARFVFLAAGAAFGAGAFGFATAVAAPTILGFRQNFMPMWAVYLGIPVTLLLLASGAGAGYAESWVKPILAVSFLAMMGWILAISVTLWRHPEKVDQLDLDALSSQTALRPAVKVG